MYKSSLFAMVALLSGALHAVETPFTPFKDGYANSSLYNGTSKTLIVRAGDSKAWVAHALGDGSGKGLVGARLSIYVKDIVHDGTLRVSLASSMNYLENQTRFENLKNSDSLGTVSLKAAKDIQTMVSISLSDSCIKKIQEGSFAGFILEGANGLDAELGAIEGAHGALLYLAYDGGTKIDSSMLDTIAKTVVSKYSSQLKGADGLKGAKGDTGATGPQGPKGDKGDTGATGAKGDKGDAGAAADQAPIFQLLQDRGKRLSYSFDRFSSGTPTVTPDSSGNGNNLTLSGNGKNLVQLAAGDSAVQFLGNGYGTASNSMSLNPYKEITLSAKVKLSAGTLPDTQVILAKKNQYEMAIVKVGANAKLRVRFKTVLADWAWTGDGDISTVDSVWTSVQASYDGKAIRTFINGKQVFYSAASNGPLVLDSLSLFVGNRSATTDSLGLKGTLDQVNILSYAVSDQDSLNDLNGTLATAQLPPGYKYPTVIDSVASLQTALNNKAGIVFIDNVTVQASSNPNITSSTFADLASSVKSESLPAGTAVIFWSLSYWANPSVPATSTYGGYRVRPAIGGFANATGTGVYTNEASSHKSASGSYIVTIPTAGTYSVRLQVQYQVGGAFTQDANDSVTWTILVFR